MPKVNHDRNRAVLKKLGGEKAVDELHKDHPYFSVNYGGLKNTSKYDKLRAHDGKEKVTHTARKHKCSRGKVYRSRK